MYKVSWIVTHDGECRREQHKYFPEEYQAHDAYREIITASGLLGIADWIHTINITWEEE